MLTSNVRKLVRKIWGSSATAIPPRPPMRLWLEKLEDRSLPSTSSLSAVFEASPPAASSAAAISSFMDSMAEQRVQLMATIVQYANNVWNTLGQEMVQEVASLQQQLDRILGISPNTQNQSNNAAVSQSNSNSGAGRGSSNGSGSGAATTTQHASDQTLNNSPQQPAAVRTAAATQRRPT